MGGEWWRLIGIYINRDLDRKLERLKQWLDEREEGVRFLIEGDFNVRTGGEEGGGGEVGKIKDEMRRESKDKKINGEGRKLCRFLRDREWEVFNGGIEGDEEGEWTYSGGRGESVIDYIIGNEVTREKVIRMKVEERIDSDHYPLVVWIEGGEGRIECGKKKKRVLGK